MITSKFAKFAIMSQDHYAHGLLPIHIGRRLTVLSFVVESLKTHLEELGHEVYVFCPARSIRPSKHAEGSPKRRIISYVFPASKVDCLMILTSVYFSRQCLSHKLRSSTSTLSISLLRRVGLVGIQAAYKTISHLSFSTRRIYTSFRKAIQCVAWRAGACQHHIADDHQARRERFPRISKIVSSAKV